LKELNDESLILSTKMDWFCYGSIIKLTHSIQRAC